MDRDARIERFLPLRPVEFHVLLSLSRGERHGYRIMQDAERLGEKLDVGTLYRALSRMVDQGLIDSVHRRAPEGEHERRNYYRATRLGTRVARAEARRLAMLTNAAWVGGLLEEPAR